MNAKDMNLNDLQKDILKEISNIGVGNASIALSKMLRAKIDLSVPLVQILPLDKIANLVSGENGIIACVYFGIEGDVKGNILVILTKRSALSLIELLLNKTIDSPTTLEELDRSALREMGNILTSAYLGTLSEMLGITLFPTVPGLVLNDATNVKTEITDVLATTNGESLLVETQFKEQVSSIHGRFFLVLDKESVHTILDAAKELASQ